MSIGSAFKSVFTGVEKAAGSTVAWLEKELVAFEQKAPAIEKVIDAGLAYIGPVLKLVLTDLGDTAASNEVTNIVGQAQNDLKAASALVTDFGATPTAASIFSSVATNLGALLTAGHVTSTQSVAAVNKAVDEIGVIGSAVQLAVEALKPSTANAVTAAAQR